MTGHRKWSDREKIVFLRNYLDIGHTDGTPFEVADVKLRHAADNFGYMKMSELTELVDYFIKLALMVNLGTVISPADRFAYRMLQDNGIFRAFHSLNEVMSRKHEKDH